MLKPTLSKTSVFQFVLAKATILQRQDHRKTFAWLIAIQHITFHNKMGGQSSIFAFLRAQHTHPQYLLYIMEISVYHLALLDIMM